MADERSLLQTRDLGKRFGGVTALSALDIDVAPGELLGLIGPNGSGKTTAFNLLSGILRPTSGMIVFRGHDISRSRPERNAALGMSRTFQNIRLFPELPAVDNVAVGLHMRHGKGLWATVSALPHALKSEKQIYQRAREILIKVGLGGRSSELVANLPYGDKRKVELARALATDPVLLLLDEPSAGMNPQETREISETIIRIHREQRVAIVLVEHDMKLVMGVCERIVVINRGQTLAAGSPEDIRNNPEVVEAYLGPSREAHLA